jgi:single-stranded-DNA-specific exonuclease
MLKNWLIGSKINKEKKENFSELHPVVVQMLFNRGLSDKKSIEAFLHPDYKNDTHNPFDLPDMEKAVQRILEAIRKKEKVYVYGDYDADGVCSSALMVRFFKTLGVDVDVYIPYRETEGYGMNEKAVLEIADKGAKLVITVDCGIASANEVEILKKKNIDVIITDHHNPIHKIPKAVAVVNPKITSTKDYTNKELSGTAIAFKVVQAVLSERVRKENPDIDFPKIGFEKWYLDLVGISLVTDMCELKGENRTLLTYGLKVLQKSKTLGIKSLLAHSNGNLKEINTHAIGFQIGPRLNAAGRLGHASTSYQLLVTNDNNEADKLAEQLNNTNKERQELTETMFKEAVEQVGDSTNQKILFAKHNDWPKGLVGLVSGKITDRFFRPSLVMSEKSDGEVVGSGRSVAGFNITEALKESSEYLLHYGGHSQACGFTLKSAESFHGFKEKMIEVATRELEGKDLRPVLNVEAELLFEEISWDLINDLEKMKPFGMGNEQPYFLTKNLEVVEAKGLGQNGNHLRMMVKNKSGQVKKTIGFYCSNKEKWGVDWCEQINVGDIIDVVYELGINEWNGNREIQLTIIDMNYSTV